MENERKDMAEPAPWRRAQVTAPIYRAPRVRVYYASAEPKPAAGSMNVLRSCSPNLKEMSL
jgi:hypothetical protein